MNKDVIYIDVEDDITAIIGKVKASKEKIVAIVPPKRIGLLQSAVNLRLIGRAAETGDKRLVLITSNQALMALAASAKIPVAKNLQSKPELPEIAALDIDDGEDVIDGATLPIGEHAKMSQTGDSDNATDIAAAEIMEVTKPGDLPTSSDVPTRTRVKKASKVPNFNRFRKRMILIIVAVILFIAFMIWAIFIAPRATIVITARTTGSTVNQTVNLSDETATDFNTAVIRSITKTQQKKANIEFEATGKENHGKTASGSVTLVAQKCSGNPFSTPSDVPAGTIVSSGNQNYKTESATSFTGSGTSGGCYIYDATAATPISASGKGEDYNVNGGSFSVSDRADVTGSGSASGGTDDIVKIVTASDVQAARKKLVDGVDDSIKDTLKTQFDKDVTIIDDSFQTDIEGVTSSPDVGGEAASSPTLTGTITYSIVGIANNELDTYLKAALETNLEDQATQRVYDTGRDKIQFSDFTKKSGNTKVILATTGQLGPKIDDNEIKDKVKGKQYGDIQADLESISGVDSADTKFFPFWVNTVPNDPKKITVEFKLNEQQ